MKTSSKGIDLIKQFEGCKLTAYKPVSTEKYWTVGYGHYGADVSKGMVITSDKAEELLKADLVAVERVINALNINMKQQQFDALVSFIFNLGSGAFGKSTLKKYIVARKPDVDITDQLVKWHNAGGKPMLGLKRRRVAEANMWHGKTVYRIDSSGNIKR